MTSAAAPPGALSLDQLREAHRLAYTLRRFEERVGSIAARGQLRGSTHLAIGQEAVSVGARLATRPGDVVAPTYRGHNWALAWGVPLASAFGEMLGRETGSNRGRGGSKHIGDRARGVLPSNAIVAAALPIACGVAWQAKLDGLDRVVVVPFGDGATNQAVFHEAMNLARMWVLPVVFVCENNLYSEMTPIAMTQPFDDLVDRAAGYDMPATIVDGMDVEATAGGLAPAVARARSGEGPTFVEAKTYRFCGHMPGDTEPYRDAAEIERWRERDPIEALRRRLAAGGIDPDDIAGVEREIDAEVDAADAQARSAPEPAVDAIALGAASWMEATR